MGNTNNEILGELKSLLESLKTQIVELEEKVAELEASTGDAPAETPADIPAEEPQPEAISFDDLDSMPEVDLSEFEAPAPVAAEVAAPAVPDVMEEAAIQAEETEKPIVEDLPADEDALSFFMTGEKEDINKAMAKQVRKKTVAEAMEAKMLWKTAIPGGEVKDVRSAISLNDRVLFINKLFSENPAEFQQAVSVINSASSLEELISYFTEHYPQWDMDSDLVFRFMMAVRRKVRS